MSLRVGMRLPTVTLLTVSMACCLSGMPCVADDSPALVIEIKADESADDGDRGVVRMARKPGQKRLAPIVNANRASGIATADELSGVHRRVNHETSSEQDVSIFGVPVRPPTFMRREAPRRRNVPHGFAAKISSSRSGRSAKPRPAVRVHKPTHEVAHESKESARVAEHHPPQPFTIGPMIKALGIPHNERHVSRQRTRDADAETQGPTPAMRAPVEREHEATNVAVRVEAQASEATTEPVASVNSPLPPMSAFIVVDPKTEVAEPVMKLAPVYMVSGPRSPRRDHPTPATRSAESSDPPPHPPQDHDSMPAPVNGSRLNLAPVVRGPGTRPEANNPAAVPRRRIERRADSARPKSAQAESGRADQSLAGVEQVAQPPAAYGTPADPRIVRPKVDVANADREAAVERPKGWRGARPVSTGGVVAMAPRLAVASSVRPQARDERRAGLLIASKSRALTDVRRSVSDIEARLETGERERPSDLARERFAAAGTMTQPMGYSRTGLESLVLWEAPATKHQALVFEDVNLERHGTSAGVFQPLLSAAHFFGRVPALPYLMAAEGGATCHYTLGHYRPGSCAPYQMYLPPLDIKGLSAEATSVLGLLYLIP